MANACMSSSLHLLLVSIVVPQQLLLLELGQLQPLLPEKQQEPETDELVGCRQAKFDKRNKFDNCESAWSVRSIVLLSHQLNRLSMCIMLYIWMQCLPCCRNNHPIPGEHAI